LNTSMSEMLVDVSMGSCTDGNFDVSMGSCTDGNFELPT